MTTSERLYGNATVHLGEVVVGDLESFLDQHHRAVAGRRPIPPWHILSEQNVYIPGRVFVTKRLIDLNDDLLAAAQRELKTTGVTDTVRAALQHAAAISARSRQVEWLKSGGLAEMADPEARGDVWR